MMGREGLLKACLAGKKRGRRNMGLEFASHSLKVNMFSFFQYNSKPAQKSEIGFMGRGFCIAAEKEDNVYKER